MIWSSNKFTRLQILAQTLLIVIMVRKCNANGIEAEDANLENSNDLLDDLYLVANYCIH